MIKIIAGLWKIWSINVQKIFRALESLLTKGLFMPMKLKCAKVQATHNFRSIRFQKWIVGEKNSKRVQQSFTEPLTRGEKPGCHRLHPCKLWWWDTGPSASKIPYWKHYIMEAKAHWLSGLWDPTQAAGMCKSCFLLEWCFIQLLASICFRRHKSGFPRTPRRDAVVFVLLGLLIRPTDEHYSSWDL